MADLDALRRAYRDSGSEDDSIHLSEERWERLACGDLPAEEREAALDHILTCPQCSDIYRALGILREEARAFDPGVPAANEGTRTQGPARKNPWGGLVLLAAAAALLMAVVLPTFSPDAPESGAGPEVLRSAEDPRSVTPLAPVGQEVPWQAGTGVVFRWKLEPVNPVVVEILDSDGELVWSSPPTTATEMAWPSQLPPKPGRYYWRVVVTGAGDKRISSDLVSFELSASLP